MKLGIKEAQEIIYASDNQDGFKYEAWIWWYEPAQEFVLTMRRTGSDGKSRVLNTWLGWLGFEVAPTPRHEDLGELPDKEHRVAEGPGVVYAIHSRGMGKYEALFEDVFSFRGRTFDPAGTHIYDGWSASYGELYRTIANTPLPGGKP